MPRVIYKNVIISRAMWRFNKKEFDHIFRGMVIDKVRNFDKFRKLHKIPQMVLIKTTEGELFLNLKSIQCIEILLNVAKKLKDLEILTLYENLMQYGFSNVSDSNGSYENEYLFSFINSNNNSVNNEKCSEIKFDKYDKNRNYFARKFLPDSEWLFYCIFCNKFNSDKILLLFKSLYIKECKLFLNIDKWFFIRYNVPSYHLRFRFHFKNGNICSEFKTLITNFILRCESEKLVWKIQIETYEREVERYGTDSIELAEKLFSNDSRSVLTLINKQFLNFDIKTKLLVGLKSVDMFLKDFNLNHYDCVNFTSFNINQLNNSDGTSIAIKSLQNKYYLEIKESLSKILEHNILNNDSSMAILASLNLRSHENRLITAQLIKNVSPEKLMDYLRGYIHMNLNRIFIDNHKKYENLIYYILNKYYISRYKKLNLLKK